MPQRPQYNIQQRIQQTYTGQHQQRHNQLAPKQTLKKIRNINGEETKDKQETAEETIDPESTCYIREMMEDWQNINFMVSVKFTDENAREVNKTK